LLSSFSISSLCSHSERNYHGVCRLPSKVDALHRRIDILWTPYDQYHYALLYFTGSGFHNIQMRRIALEKGYTLNEAELLPLDPQTGRCGEPVLVKSEEEIYKLLGMKYREPVDRDLAPNWKPVMNG
jgi:DNA polymerase/3'-5' exonuclease PolX